MIAFLALNLAKALSKFFYANYLDLNNLDSYLLQVLTALIFYPNLVFNPEIYFDNNSFLLANALLSSSKNFLVVIHDYIALASFYSSKSLLAYSFANKVFKTFEINPFKLDNALTVF